MKAEITSSLQGKYDGKIVEISQWVVNERSNHILAVVAMDDKFIVQDINDLKPRLDL